MKQLYEVLLHEKQYLNKLEKMLTESVGRAPEGNLRIAHHGKAVQYYCKSGRDDKEHPQGRYIRKEEIRLAKDIAQRDYDSSLLREIQERQRAIDKLQKLYKLNTLETAYEKLNPYRKELVEPRILSDKEYLKKWTQVECIKKDFEEGLAVICSNRGERVRSKSEKIIADTLDKRKIPYRYEAPLQLRGMGIVYPDFTILDVKQRREIYWEHLGMMDNTEYCERAMQRIESYQRNGLMLGDRLIITYETSEHPLETEAIDRVIKAFC